MHSYEKIIKEGEIVDKEGKVCVGLHVILWRIEAIPIILHDLHCFLWKTDTNHVNLWGPMSGEE